MMSKWICPLILAFSIIVAVPLHCVNAESENISVKVRETRLRSQPKAWAPGTQTLLYGTQLSVVGTQDGWFKVRTSSGKEGFLHPSAVTDKKIVFTTNATPSKSADASNVVLAGKGFSKEVEAEYAKSNPALKFGELNQIERVKISDGELLSFMRQGMLGKGAL
jgi:hypothetical protein